MLEVCLCLDDETGALCTTAGGDALCVAICFDCTQIAECLAVVDNVSTLQAVVNLVSPGANNCVDGCDAIGGVTYCDSSLCGLPDGDCECLYCWFGGDSTSVICADSGGLLPPGAPIYQRVVGVAFQFCPPGTDIDTYLSVTFGASGGDHATYKLFGCDALLKLADWCNGGIPIRLPWYANCGPSDGCWCSWPDHILLSFV